ncbi:uncharacterized protein K02A2.6-like [Ornithodoros turicata]|uniref:uncharacterized protein K02A2.6-like n=1 Tax=Ornithodoros turicata TaxID=34597 RepID=UPI0031389876
MFDPNLPVVVTTDASDCGLGAVLQQRSEEGLQTVAFASRTLSSAERKYSVGEKEALAWLFACEQWHVYLWGRRFLLRTDHQALVTLLSSGGSGRRPVRISRWTARLLYYKFEVQYQRGSDNVVADALSRLPASATQAPNLQEEIIATISAYISKDEVQKSVEDDHVLQKVMEFVTTGWPGKKEVTKELWPFYHVKAELSVVDGLLLRDNKVVIPEALTSTFVEFAHDSHQGIVRTKQRLRNNFWWPKMDSQVEAAVRNCLVCQSCDKTAKPSFMPMQPVPFPEEPWEQVAMDIVGPFHNAPPGCKFAITLVDYHSKWPEVGLTDSVTSRTVMDFLLAIFSREGYPATVLTDNRPQFKSKAFENFLSERGIRHNTSSLYYPQANGLVERFNRVLKDFVQIALLESRPLKSAILNYLASYRCTPHATTGASPAMLLHGRQPRTKVDIVGLPSGKLHPKPAPTKEVLRKHVEGKQSYSKRYTDAHRSVKKPIFKEGDCVRVRKSIPQGKGALSYTRPLKIVKQKGVGTFVLEDGRTWNASKLVAASHITQPVEQDRSGPHFWHLRDLHRRNIRPSRYL